MRAALQPALAGHQLPAQAVHRRLAQQPAASVCLMAGAAGGQAAAGQGLARGGPWPGRPECEGDQAASIGRPRRGFREAWVGQGAAGFCLQVLQGVQGGLEASVGVQATAQVTLLIASQFGTMCVTATWLMFNAHQMATAAESEQLPSHAICYEASQIAPCYRRG
jgi:hypothetical protein